MEYASELQNCVNTLQDGKVLLYPTDTIWGIGCDPFREDTVKRIAQIKQRPQQLPFILLASSVDMIHDYTDSLHPRVETLLTIHTKPLTIVYPSAKNLPDYLLANDGSIAIRICQDAFCQEMIQQFGKPIVSTSANISGQPFPSRFGEISSSILRSVDYVARLRQNEVSETQPSVIATFTQNGQLEFLRE